MTGAALAADPQAAALNEAQIYAARIEAMTTACEVASPAVAAPMEPGYVGWLERNPVIAQEALHALHFGPGAEARLAAYCTPASHPSSA